MRSLRYLYVLALVLWLGGMAVAGLIVAPTIFEVLGAWNESTGRVLAGQVFAEILRRLSFLAYGSGVVMFIVLTVQRVLGPKPRAYGVRAGLVLLMLAVTAYSALLIAPRIEALQREVNGPVNQLPTDDPRRVEFDSLHRLATMLMSGTMVGGLVLIGWETRE